MNIKKTLAVVGSGLLSLPVAHAEGTTPTVDVSAAEGSVDAIGTAISGLLTGKVMTNVLIIIGAGLAIGMVFLAVRWLLKGGKAAAK